MERSEYLCGMKRLVFSIFIIILSIPVFAQGRASAIRGRVLEPDGSPVMYASAAIFSDGKAVTGAMTDSVGIFTIKGHFSGEYVLRVSSIGYNDIEKSIVCGMQTTVDAGDFILSKDISTLSGAVVTSEAASRSVTVEKTRINPSASITAATGSVLEVIRNASSVTVDGSDNVSIRGNSNVLVLVDGVPTTLGGLGAIPAANVQSIDIVTSPDVKYDSEGTGGIISIVSKKQSANSFNAMASFNYGFDGFLNGNFAMNCNKGRWGVRVNYNGKYEKDLIESELHRQIKSTGNTIDQTIDAVKKTSNQTAGLNAMFKATKKDILTFDFKAIFPRMNNFQNFNNHYMTSGTPGDKFRQTDITFNRETFEGSLGYRHIFEPEKKELNVTAAMSSITGHRPSFYYEEGEMVQKSESGGHPFNTSLQVDYMTKAGKGKFETGAKMTYRQNNIDHKMFEKDPSTGVWEQSIPLSNDLKHREYIPAAYAMYSSKLASNLSLKGGVRLEYSHVTLHSDKERLDEGSDCWFLAPNLVLNWKISDPWSMTFGLSRRISRPTYPQLNPYINLIDNQTYETGNIHLQPEKASKLDAGYSFVSGKVTINGNAYLAITKDYINQVAGIKDDILVMTYINGDMDLKAGTDHSFKFSLCKWLTMDLATNTYFTTSEGTYAGAAIHNHGWVSNSNVAFNFKPVKGMNIQTQYFVTTPQYFPQFTTRTIHYGNIGLSRSFLKGALTASATLTDVFNTRRWDIRSDNTVYSLVNNSKNLSRMLWLGITWNINSYKPLKGAQKKQEEDRSVIRIGD